ncbi:DNA integrity scanning diadenylate cyclase DisA [Clostridioides mangenotii]|uniref:DNA integrity scanning diadenylate cyclase DisA n=1 Tax=Metaclostridioides mangenotii TaxID=1540 RepID=UPI0018D027E0|nr:DNA integrity scanning diadenylate cyclase DisA [Clostridioides mangenotii]MBH0311657.1 DNA integrity scanning protein DisA [Alcaligenes faecalis]MBU5308654.1 DNA integrity scanning diadenylate cyclase DisA [Clostridioides mangenotii]MCR1954402.1 DNA integrity scanning diadenylate cyclase DisA [Clostridioides mangenotii]
MDDILNNKDMLEALKMISPGTPLRRGLNNVLKAKTGALIVLSTGEEVMSLVNGGFSINADYSSAYLYELAKMDGAIVLSGNLKKILHANVQLVPDNSIPSSETGTRHRTAERVAKQTDAIVISVSQKRSIITIYRGNHKYEIEDISKIFTKVNQAIQTLEKYKSVLDQVIASLNTLEFNDLVTVYDVALVMQKIEMVMRVTNIIEKYVIELGDEGTLVSMQLEELMGTTYFDLDQVFKDYNISEDEISTFKENIKKLSSEDLIDLTKIAKLLGYKDTSENMDMQIRSKGYRILSKIHRLPNTIVDNLACYFENFQSVLCASLDTLCDVDGVGEIRAKHIKNELVKMQQLVLLDKKI